MSPTAQRARHACSSSAERGRGNDPATPPDIRSVKYALFDSKYSIVAKDGFPFAQYRDTGNLGSKGSCVIPVDLKANVVEAHNFLFDTEEYEISEEVKSYSQKISADTGR